MSHFYGSIPTSARKTIPTARGHAATGLTVKAASYQGAIQVRLCVNKDGVDRYCVEQVPHLGKGKYKKLCFGTIGE